MTIDARDLDQLLENSLKPEAQKDTRIIPEIEAEAVVDGSCCTSEPAWWPTSPSTTPCPIWSAQPMESSG